MKSLTSSVKLKPTTIYNTKTGEQVALGDFLVNVRRLVSYVQVTAQEFLDRDFNSIVTACDDYKKISPAEFARQKGINISGSDMPQEILGKSRINKLIGHAVISTVTSYSKNPNPKKQRPRIGPTANLGAVDKQLASLSIEDNVLTLLFKCWDTEYLLEFNIPDYFMRKNIIKWSLPLILKHKDIFLFQFSILENPSSPSVGNLIAGVDLGRAVPYTVAVINPLGSVVARYTSGGMVNRINQKRERLIVEKKFILNKIDSYKKLGLNYTALKNEDQYKRDKIASLAKTLANQLAADLTEKLEIHKLSALHVEDLSWVTGPKYGSRWNHSQQQASISHSLARQSVKVKKVDPRNTSKQCHSCHTLISYKRNTRSVYCSDCKTNLDRDFNAAINIAKDINKNRCSVAQRTIGDNCSSQEQVIEKISLNSMVPDTNVLNL